MFSGVIFLLACLLFGYYAGRWQDTGIAKLPTVRQLKTAQDKEKYVIQGMQEVNRWLAVRQLPDDEWMDIGCEFCDTIRMDVTQQELDAEGWTCVNGSTRCPDCSSGKERLKGFIGESFVPIKIECGCASLGECCKTCAPHWWD